MSPSDPFQYEFYGKQEEPIMKKRFKLTDLDCANCAAKMETAIKKIDGVSDSI